MKIIEEENNYLESTLKVIDEEIDYANKRIQDLEKTGVKLSYEDKKRGDHLNVNSMLGFYNDIVRKLTSVISSPYFGRIDFLFDETNELLKIYIGKCDISHNGETTVTDWRAPICSLYYDSELGKASYLSPSGIIDGNLELKRQILIEDSKLVDAYDTSLVTDDDLLKPYLSANADNKMKIIIASIQKEQNQIIRKDAKSNIIVQGVAGSGKTSVALHRIAYLVYDAINDVKSNQFLVLGPNDYFLNYISSILPELETEPVEQKTFFEFVSDYLGYKVDNGNLDESLRKKFGDYLYEKIQSYKSSMKFKSLIEKYIDYYIKNELFKEDFIIDGKTIFNSEDIKKVLFSSHKEYIDFDRTSNYFIEKFKNNVEDIYTKINEKYRNVYINLPKGDPVREKAVKDSMDLYKTVKEKGLKLVKDYFKKNRLKATDIYKMFIDNIDKYDNDLIEEEIISLNKITTYYLNKKKVMFEDLPSLLYIEYLLNNKKTTYKHIVIDEAQDYGLFHFYAIKKISPSANYSIYGDLAQSVYSYRGLKDWNDVGNQVFDRDYELLHLNKSYRTTIEITENANQILRKMNLFEANPVVRHGEKVCFEGETNNIDFKVDIINSWIDKGYKTIAIICKDEKETKDVYKELTKSGLQVNFISNIDSEYTGGIVVLTSAAAKGLEFDAVIINDASEKQYSSLSENDMHLLYVASTRALHEQIILYDKELCNVFSNGFEEENAKKLIGK